MVVQDIVKIMNAYAPEDLYQFCNDILDSSCSNDYAGPKIVRPYKDVTKWVFYITLLRQWHTEDFGTFIDYFQRYLYMFDPETLPSMACYGDLVERIRKEKRPSSIQLKAIRARQP